MALEQSTIDSVKQKLKDGIRIESGNGITQQLAKATGITLEKGKLVVDKETRNFLIELSKTISSTNGALTPARTSSVKHGFSAAHVVQAGDVIKFDDDSKINDAATLATKGAKKEEAPAKKEEAPAKKEEAPAKKEEAPAKKEEAPAKKEEAPAKKEEAPAKKEEAPAKKEEAPAKKEEAPAKKEEAPAVAHDTQADSLESRVDDYLKANGYSKMGPNEYISKDRDLTITIKDGKVDSSRSIGRIFGSWGLSDAEKRDIAEVAGILAGKSEK